MCEISASYWEYTGQLLRTFAVADEPPPLYRELHAVADAAFEATSGRLRAGATALEVLSSAREPLLAVAGALISPLQVEDAEKARVLGKPLRQGGLAAALRSGGEAEQIADALARAFDLGPLRTVIASEPRFACRCSRERVVRALLSLGATPLREMAEKDRGARLTCDFCNAAYSFSASELIALGQP